MPPAKTYGQRVYRACREHTEIAYLRARKQQIPDPVVLIDTRNQDERRERIARERELPAGFEMAHVSIMIGPRHQIAQRVAAISVDAGKDVASRKLPRFPFTVVIVGKGTVEIFNEEEPEIGHFQF